MHWLFGIGNEHDIVHLNTKSKMGSSGTLGEKSVRARAQKECVTQVEALIMAREIHLLEGHFGRDSIKEKLMDRIKSPYLDRMILEAIKECGRCKGFGNTHLHSLLEPIMCLHPWELLVGDYLSMSKGKGGFNTSGST
jgi:hypothetical protein